MKKFFILIAVLFFSSISVSAETVKVKAITPISVQVLDNVSYNSFNFVEGNILYGEMVDVIQPQKYGKNATFSFKIVSFLDNNGIKHTLSKPITIKYRQQLKPNFERSTFSSGCWSFSPYDVTLMKESSSVGAFIKKDTFKDAFWQPGWQIIIKSGDNFHFNLPE